MPAKSIRKRPLTTDTRPPSGALPGYARVSKGNEQNNALQTKALRASGCQRLFEEAASGGRWDRPELYRPVAKFIAVRPASRAFGLCLAATLTAAVDLVIVDPAGDPGGIRAAPGWFQAEQFKQRDAWLVVSDGRVDARSESSTTVAVPLQAGMA